MFGRKRLKANKLPRISTVIGKGTEIVGDVRFEGGLHVDGRVVGSILATDDDKNTLVLSEIGYVEGDVRVPNAVLNGEIHGDVYASNRVDLVSKARVHGTVYYKYLEMMIGAVVNGQLIRADEQRAPLVSRVEPLEKGATDAPSGAAIPETELISGPSGEAEQGTSASAATLAHQEVPARGNPSDSPE